MKTKTDRIRKWDYLSATWALTTPPAIPSNEDILHFKGCLQNSISNPPMDVVLLGSTIGLRKLLLEDFPNTRLHCVDWSEKMYNKLTEVGKINNPNEIYYCEDWVNFSLKGKKVDAIIGDKALDNVPYNQWAELFSNFYGLLKDYGIIVLHVGLITDYFREVHFESALNKWAQLVDSQKVSLDDAASGLWEDCLSGSAFIGAPEDHSLSVSKYSNEISTYVNKLEKQDSTLWRVYQKFQQKFSSSFNDEWTAFTLDELREFIEGKFVIRNIFYSSDYDAASSQPIIEMVKKN